jgi:hypothetical protein
LTSMELSNKMAPYKVHGLTIGVHIILFVPIGQHKFIALVNSNHIYVLHKTLQYYFAV